MNLIRKFIDWYRYEAPLTRAAIHRGAHSRRGVADERAVSAMLAFGWANCGIKNGPTKAWCREAFYRNVGKFVRDYYASHGFYPHGDHCLPGHTVPIHFRQREPLKEPAEKERSGGSEDHDGADAQVSIEQSHTPPTLH